MPPKTRTGAGAKKTRRREKKNIAHGHAHIKSTFNNTIVSITDPMGAVISWASAGHVGFKGSRKSTPFAAQMAAESAARKAQEHGMRKVDVFVKGPGCGTRDGDPLAAGRRPGGRHHPGRHPAAPQRLPPAEASAGLKPEEETEDMARYTGADCKLCRREKMKLFLKGAKCESPKCPIEIRPYPPGEHGRGRSKESEYLLQLREKQKARRIYGVLEKQFRGYYDEANRQTGKTGEVMLRILESRLDNVVYRAGFAKSRDMARQLVRHGHIIVNGHKVDIPSYRVGANDIVEVREASRELTPFVVARAEAGSRPVPPWLEVISNQMRILVHSLPARQVIDTQVQEQLIVEFYSK